VAYIITAPCIGVKDGACLAVCPVDCIYGKPEDEMYYIHPDECIDCGACLAECPVGAIYEEIDVPDRWRRYIYINADNFQPTLV